MRKKMVLALFILCLLMFAGCKAHANVSYKDADKYVAGNQEYVGELNKLYINWICGEVNLIQDDNADKITITEYNDLDEDKKVHSWFNDHDLYIQFAKPGYYIIDANLKKLEIKYKDLNKLEVKLTSGTFNTTDIEADEVLFDLTSGDVNINDISADRVSFDFTSGDVNINSIEANEVKIDFTSGESNIKVIKADTLNIDLSSGNMKIQELYTKNLNYAMSSGDSELGIKACERGSFDFTSGDLSLKLPDDKYTQIKLDKTSGRFSTDKTYTKIADDYYFGPAFSDKVDISIYINMTSGKVKIL